MLPEDRPTVAERYVKALRSSHLEVDAETRGDVDMLVAAGYVREGVGTALYRTRAEFDAVRRSLLALQSRLEAADAGVEVQLRAQRRLLAGRPSDGAKKMTQEQVERAREQVEIVNRDALTERTLIRGRLQSLRDTRMKVTSFALVHASRERFELTSEVVQTLAIEGLEAWIDPVCPKCGGRCQTGNYGSPPVLCTACRGTGSRRLSIGSSPLEYRFARSLLAALDQKVHNVDRAMVRWLRREAA